jgi:branched-chain amino acid transport system permease protein
LSNRKSIPHSNLLNIAVYLVLLIALLALADRQLNDYYLRVLSEAAIYVILTVSLNLTNGFTGDFSLGHAAFMTIGAYVSAWLTLPIAKKGMMIPRLPLWLKALTLPEVLGNFLSGGVEGTLSSEGGVALGFLLAVVIGGLVATLVALLVGIPVLRLRGHYLAVATLGLMFIVRTMAVKWVDITRGGKGINGLPRYTNIWWTCGWALLTIYVVWRLVHSPYGRAMMAIREDELAAAARGINVTRHRLLSFMVSAFFAGVGGALLAHQNTTITPHVYYIDVTFRVVVMLVVGGMGSISGSVIGSVLFSLAKEYLRKLETHSVLTTLFGHEVYGLSQIIIAIAISLVMIFRREGLLGSREIHLPRLFKEAPPRSVETEV